MCAYSEKGEKKNVMYDLQKASMWKRISAWLLDAILLVIVITGVLFLLSSCLDYDGTLECYTALQQQYIEEYGVDMSLTELTEEQQALREQANAAFQQDAEANRLYGKVVSQGMLLVSFSPLIAYLLLEFLVPLLFGNGQTLGKKVFGIAVMREDGVRLSTLALFVRTVLGKYTVETMLPVLFIALAMFGSFGLLGTVLALALLVAQIAMLIATKTNSALHDKLSYTVTVDMASQMIFDTPEELLAYKKRMQAEKAAKADY